MGEAMRVLCFGYRPWARRIYESISSDSEAEVIIGPTQERININLLSSIRPDVVLLYGWSWIVPEEITENYLCLMLHPSALPKFRGGSPLQNQIISGVEVTKLTLFRMNAGIDEGPILGQEDLSLSGDIADIFDRLTELGLSLTRQFLKGELKEIQQDHGEATYCKRRTPSDSEITTEELLNTPARKLYDKIRALSDPYPNAYIRTADNKRLLLKKVEVSDDGEISLVTQ